jgi:putative nucleotidyltransferase with HDIG domain
MDSRIILKKLDRIDSLQTLPSVALEVNRMLLDYNTSIKELTEIIEKDQAIASRILKLSNSTFYGFRRRVNNIPHSVVLLGFNVLRNAIISVSVMKTFSSQDTFEGFDISDFWKHSVAVAMVSKNLGDKLNYQTSDDCFLAGLLHDIGKIILSQYFQDLFDKILTSARKLCISFYEAERREMPVDHAMIGGHLADKWQLPIEVVDTVKYHHTLNDGEVNHKVTTIVHAANIIVNSYSGEKVEKVDFSLFHPEARRLLKPQLENVSEWFPQMSKDIESACDFFIERN